MRLGLSYSSRTNHSKGWSPTLTSLSSFGMINDDEAVKENNDMDSPWVERILDLPALLEKKSYFLFGPRQTGKTFLIRHTLTNARIYDLLDTSIYLALSRDPGRIGQELTPQDRIVVIDEIQRLPSY